MRPRQVPRLRSRNLGLDGSPFATAQEVVRWHLAIQAQDYAPAQWSLAQRSSGTTSAEVDAAIADGTIIRTHALRPTWHFVARDDAQLVLGLTGPRVQKAFASRYAELGLDSRTLARAQRTILKALADGEHLSRGELGDRLAGSRIDIDGQRLPHMLMHCELDRAICSGARRGSEHTYAAFDDRIPPARALDHDEATRLFVERYLQSHGPAAVADLQWWASLKATDIKTALAELGDGVVSAEIDGVELWWADPLPERGARPEVRLLETYDEYVVGYTRSRFFGDAHRPLAASIWRDGGRFRNIVTRGGSVLGVWRRSKTKKKATIEVQTYERLSAPNLAALRREADRFARFYGLAPDLEISAAGR